MGSIQYTGYARIKIVHNGRGITNVVYATTFTQLKSGPHFRWKFHGLKILKFYDNEIIQLSFAPDICGLYIYFIYVVISDKFAGLGECQLATYLIYENS